MLISHPRHLVLERRVRHRSRAAQQRLLGPPHLRRRRGSTLSDPAICTTARTKRRSTPLERKACRSRLRGAASSGIVQWNHNNGPPAAQVATPAAAAAARPATPAAATTSTSACASSASTWAASRTPSATATALSWATATRPSAWLAAIRKLGGTPRFEYEKELMRRTYTCREMFRRHRRRTR